MLIQCVSNEIGAATGQFIGDIRLVGGSADWELKCCTVLTTMKTLQLPRGAQCVMTTGTQKMPKWRADS